MNVISNPDPSFVAFGRYLKSMRIQMGIPIETVAGKIKISVSQLKLIEKEAHTELPDAAYVKRILRAYARFIGVDSDDIIDRYMISKSAFEKSQPVGLKFFKYNKTAALLALVAAGILIITIVLYGYMIYGSQAKPLHNTETELLNKNDYYSSGAGEKTTVTDSVSVNPDEKLFLKIDAVEDTTLKIVVDDSDPIEYLLHPMDHMELEAAEKINLTISNAAGIKILLNEKQIDIPGASGDAAYIELPQLNK